MNIKEIMSAPAIVCRSSETLNAAAQLMWDCDVGAAPVVSDEGTIVGMITDRDVCMSAYTQGMSLDCIPVHTAMAKVVFSCRPTDSLDTVERMMVDKRIRRVPVVDAQGRPVGMVSLNDIARFAASRNKPTFEHEVTHTLAAIGQPRSAAPTTAQVAQMR